MSQMESMVGEMTVGELCSRAGLSVADFVEAAFNGSRSNGTAHTTTTTKIARGGLDLGQVLSVLASVGDAKLEDVRAKTGGTAAQVRAALRKLADAKKVKVTGQRRGTRYSAA